MKHKVICQQVVSNNCFVCGEKNTKGLKLPFYILENGEVASVFSADKEYNSYPRRMHGGVSAAILDETIGRAAEAEQNPSRMSVTLELTIRYRKPVPIGEQLICVGRRSAEISRGYTGTGEIYSADGTILVSAEGKYMFIDHEKMFENDGDFLYVSKTHPDLDFIEIPDKK